MGNSEIVVSAEALTNAFIFLLYAPVVLISYWKIIPRLSPTAKRIASGFLAAQVLVIALWGGGTGYGFSTEGSGIWSENGISPVSFPRHSWR